MKAKARKRVEDVAVLSEGFTVAAVDAAREAAARHADRCEAVEERLEEVAAAPSRDDAWQRRMTDRLSEAARALEDAERERKETAGPYHRMFTAINSLFATAVESLSEKFRARRKQLGEHIAAEERRRDEELERQRRVEQEAQAQANAAAQDAGRPAPIIIPKAAPAPVARHVDTGYGKSTVKQRPAFELVDLRDLIAAAARGEVEPELLMLNEKAVRRRLQTDQEAHGKLREIPGLRVFYDTDAAIGKGSLAPARGR